MQHRPSEQELIARFVRPFSRSGAGLALGPGDDAALLRLRPGRVLVATTDAILEGRHFSRAFLPEDIGHKALAVNLSDLAAMGAEPRWFLVALELPSWPSLRQLEGIARGMAGLARAHRCMLAGGNVARGSKLGITLTALGEVPEKLALRRDRLRPGDVLAVTGELGGAALGLRRLRIGRRRGAARQLRPTPRVSAGLAALGIARAAIDVSDGLALDLGRLAAASHVRIDLQAKAVPLAGGATLDLALAGGEDYELVFGVAPALLTKLRRKLARLAVPLTTIGRVRKGSGLFLDGTRLALSGFDHFGERGGPGTPLRVDSGSVHSHRN